MSTISASTTTTTGYVVTADTTGTLVLQTGASPTTAVTITSSQQVGVGTATPVTAVNRNLTISTSSGGAGLTLQDTGVSSKFELIGGAGGANAFGVYDLSASAYRMFIDSSGNVGIGTSSPVGAVNANSRVLNIYSSNTTTNPPELRLNGNAGSSISIAGGASQSYIWEYYNVPMTFGTNNTERMRIDSSGNLLVGTTSTNPIASRVNGWCTGPVGFVTQRASANMALGLSGTSGSHIAFYTDNGSTYVAAGNISSTGSVTAYNVASDYRIKQNIQSMKNGLETVLKLKPCAYEYIEGNQYSEGFIAHELQEVVPHAVTGEKDAIDADGKPVYQGVDSSFLIPHLVSAIQEQQAIINAQQAALETLTNRIQALENK